MSGTQNPVAGIGAVIVALIALVGIAGVMWGFPTERLIEGLMALLVIVVFAALAYGFGDALLGSGGGR